MSTPAAPTIGFANLLLAEWTKLRSVRSTYWNAAAAALAAVAIGALICWRMAHLINTGKDQIGTFDPTTFSLNGIYIAQLAAGALGVLVITSEYGTGMIRATLSAVPQRLAVLAAKGTVFGLTVLISGEVLSVIAFSIGQGLLSTAHAGTSLIDPTVLRAVIGGGLYLAAVGLLGFGIGALIRHTAGALSAFFGILFAPTVIVDLLPSHWHDAINYMPANAGSQIFAVQRVTGALGPWTGIGLFCSYVLAAVTCAAVLTRRRDI